MSPNRFNRLSISAGQDGARCARKGLGLKGGKRRLFDYVAWRSLFARWCLNFSYIEDERSELKEAWDAGFQDELYEMRRLAAEGGHGPASDLL